MSDGGTAFRGLGHSCDGDTELLVEDKDADATSLSTATAPSSDRAPIAADGAACISYSLQAFDEKDVAWVFDKLKRISDDSLTEYSIEDSEERMKVVLDRYQEQPHLLDPQLPHMFGLLTKFFVNSTAGAAGQPPDAIVSDPILRKRAILASKYMVLIAKVRGYKVIIRYLPHEVQDLPRVLFLLQQPVLIDRNWEVCYMLLLWLSIASQVPFKLALLDATGARTDAGQSGSGGAVQQMFDIAKKYLDRPQCDKRQDAAAFLLAKLLARPDTQPVYLEPTIDWILDRISATTTDTTADDKSANVGNALLALAMIFKYCARDALLSHASSILDRLVAANLLNTSTNEDGTGFEADDIDGNAASSGGGRAHRMRVRKLYMKAVQRVGLSLLRTRSHAWKYKQQRTVRTGKVLMGGATGQKSKNSDRTLQDFAALNSKIINDAGDSADSVGISNVVLQQPMNSKTGSDGENPSNSVRNGENVDAEIDDSNPPQNIELVLGELLRGLRDRDTVVRWPAAKGIGRIADRLPPDGDEHSYCADIIDSILEIFQTYHADGTWHGACLALAEMARRGCVAPASLQAILPNVERALLYDSPRGSYSVGQQVRDAACYVYWAFARAFSPQDMITSVASNDAVIPRLRASLLIVALFDREVNCRRAAAASIQESIGRQGVELWPHGIELIQLVDFEGVGRLSNTYLRLAPQICALFCTDTSAAMPSSNLPSMAQIFIEHLISYKAIHTERALRDMASKSISLLAPYCLKGPVEQRREGVAFLLRLLSDLLERCLTSTLTGAMHGLLLSVGNLFFSTCQCLISKSDADLGGDDEFGPKFAKSEQWKKISHAAVDLVMQRIPESRILHGIGQEMLREAVLHYMSCLMKSQLLAPVEVLCGDLSSSPTNGRGEPVYQDSFSRTKLMQTFWFAVRECLESRSERVQFLATKCLRDYCMLLLYDHEKFTAAVFETNYAEGGSSSPHSKFPPPPPKNADLRAIIRNSSSFDDILSAAVADPNCKSHLEQLIDGDKSDNDSKSSKIDSGVDCMPKSVQLIIDYCFQSITGPKSTSELGQDNKTSSKLQFIPPSETRRRGAIGALTALPTPVTLLSYNYSMGNADDQNLAANRIVLSHAIDICIESTRQDVWYECRWLECRAVACSTLTELLLNAITLFEEHEDDQKSSESRKISLITQLNCAVSKVFEFLSANLNDYTRESSRGDIGRTVRERALECLDRLLGKLAHFGDFERRNLLLSGENNSFKNSIEKIVAISIRLACENIDRTRNKAISLLLTVCGFLNSHTKNLSVTRDDDDESDEIESADDENVDQNSIFDAADNKNQNFYADFVADFDLLADTMRNLIADTAKADAETDDSGAEADKKLAAFRVDLISTGTLFSVRQIFHAMCQLLSSQCYMQYVINGLTLSIGSLTRLLVQDGIACVEFWLNAQKKADNFDGLSLFMRSLNVLASYAAKSAETTAKSSLSAYETMICTPILRFFSTLLEFGVFSKVLCGQNRIDVKFLLEIFDHLKVAAATSKSMPRILLWISICSGCLQFEFLPDDNGEQNNEEAIKLLDDLRQRALNRMLILLAHTYPRIRLQAAQQLQEALLLNEPELLERLVKNKKSVEEQDLEEIGARIMALLDETDWNSTDRDKSVVARDELTKLFGVKFVVKKKSDETLVA